MQLVSIESLSISLHQDFSMTYRSGMFMGCSWDGLD